MDEKIIEEAQWCYFCGKQFEDAFYILIAKFNVINNTWGEQIERPSYYCAAFAIEQFLKSYLLMEEIGFPGNRQGHDLIKLISLHRDKLVRFFEFSEEDLLQVKILNERYYFDEAYGKDDLRYARISGLRRSPHPDNLNGIIKRMDTKLNNEIHNRYRLLNKK
jgi:hypothetical protein